MGDMGGYEVSHHSFVLLGSYCLIGVSHHSLATRENAMSIPDKTS